MSFRTINIGKMILILVFIFCGTTAARQPAINQFDSLLVKGQVSYNPDYPDREDIDLLLTFIPSRELRTLIKLLPYYDKHGISPMVRILSKVRTYKLKHIYELFPDTDKDCTEISSKQEFLDCKGQLLLVDDSDTVLEDLTPYITNLHITLKPTDTVESTNTSLDDSRIEWELKIEQQIEQLPDGLTMRSLWGVSTEVSFSVGDDGGTAYFQRGESQYNAIAVSEWPGDDFDPQFPFQAFAAYGQLVENPDSNSQRFEMLHYLTLGESSNGFNSSSGLRLILHPDHVGGYPDQDIYRDVVLTLEHVGCLAPVDLNHFEIPGIEEFLSCGGAVSVVDLYNNEVTDLTSYFSELRVSLRAIDPSAQLPTQWTLKIEGTFEKKGEEQVPDGFNLNSFLIAADKWTLQIGDDGGIASPIEVEFEHF